jgi:hypothetical protein
MSLYGRLFSSYCSCGILERLISSISWSGSNALLELPRCFLASLDAPLGPADVLLKDMVCARGRWLGRVLIEKFTDQSFSVADRKYWCKFV